MLDTTRKFCTVLTDSDLSPANIETTVATIKQDPNKFFLLSTGNSRKIWNAIEDLKAGGTDSKTLTKIRMAYNLEFDLQTIFKTGNDFSTDGIAVETFADLLELLDFDKNLSLIRADYHIIINDDGIDKSSDGTDAASQAVAKLFQQAIFLNINFDIQKKSELKMAIMKERFREKYFDLCTQLKEQKEFLQEAVEHGNLNNSGKQRVAEMYEALKRTEDRLAVAKKRPIRIAAMGTKKAGKSVVINSLLRRDYAPTSSLLPTPNTVKYIPTAEDSLRLDYAGKQYTFDTADALKSFIGDEFKKAQKKTGKGSDLPDMTVYYPCKELNGYEVWDTPGPNFAGAGDEHRKNAEACIKEVDVCVFVMNYSSYLTDDEVKFLKQIREFFQASGKFYSLFITVNRIDERYSSQAEKSIVYVLDYIGSRLEQLNYKNIVTFGTSALQSFYLDKLIELAKADGATETPFIDGDILQDIEANHEDEDDSITTQINFVEGAIKNLRRFHGIKGATEKEIEAYSGVPQLRSYVKYIGEAKADLEIVAEVMRTCEAQFAIIKTALNVVEFETLSEEAKRYLASIVPLIAEVNTMAEKFKGRDILSARDILQIQSSARSEVEGTQNESLRKFDNNVNLAVSRLNISEDDIRALANLNFNQADFMQTLDNKVSLNFNQADCMQTLDNEVKAVFEGIKKDATERMKKSIENLSYSKGQELTKSLNAASQEIINKVGEINTTLKKSGVPTIVLPEFPVSVSIKVSSANISGSIDTSSLVNFANDAIKVVERTGFFGWIADLFTTKTEVDIDEFKDNIKQMIKESGHKKIPEVFNELSEGVRKELDRILDDFIKTCDDTGEMYQQIFKRTLYDINLVLDETGKKKDELDRNISVLKNIGQNLRPFFDIWSYIRKEQD